MIEITYINEGMVPPIQEKFKSCCISQKKSPSILWRCIDITEIWPVLKCSKD